MEVRKLREEVAELTEAVKRLREAKADADKKFRSCEQREVEVRCHADVYRTFCEWFNHSMSKVSPKVW